MSPSCIDSMTMDCEDFRCSTNVIKIYDATAGKVNVYAVNGGRRLWDFDLSKGTGAVWVNNRYSNRCKQVAPGTYSIYVKDAYDGYSTLKELVTIQRLDSSRIPVLLSLFKNAPDAVQINWITGNTSGISKYPIRVRNVGGIIPFSLYASYIAVEQQTNTYTVNHLPNGRYRFDLRGNCGGSFTGSVIQTARSA